MSTVDKDKLPVHIGFIMDGNGRWAQKRGLPRKFGHREGALTFRKIARCCKKIGIRYATFYAFSTENWSRPKDEIDELMKLFGEYIDEVSDYADENTRLIFLGDKSAFGKEMADKMTELERASRDFNDMTILLAMNYGGRDDIVHAARRIASMVENKEIKHSDVDESLISGLLYTGGIPDADLIIRPSGEKRLSNFLIWQSAYAEFYFTDVLWPDFTPKELDKALEDFASRKRRFGGV